MTVLDNNMQDKLIEAVTSHYPDVQAIYLFGSWGTEYMREESDVDIALLLPHKKAKESKSLQMSPLQFELEKLFKRNVDLINLRQVSTVLQKEIILAERRMDCRDENAAAEFEMMTASYYQKLNEERASILIDAQRTGVFYQQ